MPKSFRIIRRKTLYRGRNVSLTRDTVLWKDGHTFDREVIHHPPSVVLLPVLPDGRIVMIRQFRAAIERFIHEIPAGTSEPGESILACCRRELAEEIGYSAAHYELLLRFFPAPGVSTEEMRLYRARGLKKLANPPAKDRDEMIAPFIVSASQAIAMVKRNEIIDAKSILGILIGLKAVQWSRGH
ncbi:MAG: NUDIX hydrolase [Candidatus Omnitrophica bacterium]|nr:NUDIX hydrolase [Candidatus Omnitrophota bacterium]